LRFRLGGINDFSTIDGDGIAFVVFFQGCRKRCKGCHNPELQPFDGGREVDTEEIIHLIRDYGEDYDSVVFQGGEPLEQVEPLREMMQAVRQMGLRVWLYTGYELQEVPEEVLRLCDVVVAGEYKEGLATGRFPASSNQAVVHVYVDRIGGIYFANWSDV